MPGFHDLSNLFAELEFPVILHRSERAICHSVYAVAKSLEPAFKQTPLCLDKGSSVSHA
ncbi:MAG: hypothetical protein KC422_11215 [Trueperaceae bacterium]|nr:hypothetical protein [Trueperaceae bacterium]